MVLIMNYRYFYIKIKKLHIVSMQPLTSVMSRIRERKTVHEFRALITRIMKRTYSFFKIRVINNTPQSS